MLNDRSAPQNCHGCMLESSVLPSLVTWGHSITSVCGDYPQAGFDADSRCQNTVVLNPSDVVWVFDISSWFANLTVSIVGHALDHQEIIDDFVAKMKDLCHLELSTEDWDAIRLITQWLKTFWSTTMQMSLMKCSTLSSTHAIFCGLQESVHGFIWDLPNDAPPHFRAALLSCHQKLSDYYYKFDESPYYVWGGCKLHTLNWTSGTDTSTLDSTWSLHLIWWPLSRCCWWFLSSSTYWHCQKEPPQVLP
jgi:hypothetical protein